MTSGLEKGDGESVMGDECRGGVSGQKYVPHAIRDDQNGIHECWNGPSPALVKELKHRTKRE